MTLRAIPKHWFSWDFTVYDGPKQVANMNVVWLRESAKITVEGVSCKAYRERLMSGAFIMETNGVETVRAEKPSALYRRFLIEYQGKQLTLQPSYALTREFILYDGGQQIGMVTPEGFFTRKALIHLPEELPLPVRVFIFWLIVMMWKRESDSS